MASSPRTRVRILGALDDVPSLAPLSLDLGNDNTPASTLENGVLKTEHSDGSATIDFSPKVSTESDTKDNFYRNLAKDIDEGELSRIANELLEGIQSDIDSSKEWRETRARGITLLGLKLEEPRADGSSTSAPIEGMSTIRHPLLLESTLRFQANARGELLPAAGPVKVRNDTPVRPPEIAPPPIPPMLPPMGHNGGPPLEGAPPMAPGMAEGGVPPMQPPMAPQMGAMGMPPPQPVTPSMPPPPDMGPPIGLVEDLASALETDMNHYLTATATEYYPDTDRMLFYVGFGGQGFKKVFNCPLRRRPVSESVDAENLIVSNAATNLEDCGRVTHRIRMRPSILKRMQILGAYLDVPITSTQLYPVMDAVEKKKNEVQGINPQPQKPQDADHEIYECYCELDIIGFEHKKGSKITGLQLPYKVTIHKESRQILEVRRNYNKDDKLGLPKQYFVEFPFVRALGFYGIGLIHIAGNTTSALTAAWREMLDAGMFASFPGFIYAKGAGRQLTNQFRVPPGGGIPMETGTMPLRDAIMPLPYREPGAGFTSFITHVEEVGQRVSGTAEIQVGEGNQEAPVGTTLALIEQATKVMDAVHKRLHAAQAHEFQLLKERFKEDPEAFWRHNRKPTIPWRKEQLLAALNNSDIVPVADPNNPTSLHRIAKATAIKMLQQANPAIYDAVNVDKRIMRIVGIDPEGLFAEKPAEPPPDPKFAAVMQKAESEKIRNQIMAQTAELNAQLKRQELADKVEQRKHDIEIQKMRANLEKLRIIEEYIIHNEQMSNSENLHNTQLHLDRLIAEQERQTGDARHEQKLVSDHVKHERKIQSDHAMNERKIQAQKERDRAKPRTSQ